MPHLAEFHFLESETPLFDRVGAEYVKHLDSLRGLIRSEVTRANLARHITDSMRSAADVGAGTGADAMWIASQGIDVVMVEPSPDMRANALQNLNSEPLETRKHIEVFEGGLSEALDHYQDQRFDLVLCHGVLMYQDDPPQFINQLRDLCKTGGLLSLVTKNAGSLAYRPALNGEYSEALSIIDSDHTKGSLGVSTAAHTMQQVADWLFGARFFIEDWYGVRVFTDHLADVAPPAESVDDILRLETAASQRDPYRAAARLLHVVARRVD